MGVESLNVGSVGGSERLERLRDSASTPPPPRQPAAAPEQAAVRVSLSSSDSTPLPSYNRTGRSASLSSEDARAAPEPAQARSAPSPTEARDTTERTLAAGAARRAYQQAGTAEEPSVTARQQSAAATEEPPRELSVGAAPARRPEPKSAA